MNEMPRHTGTSCVRCPGEGIRALGASRCPICGVKTYVRVNGRYGSHWSYLSDRDYGRLCAIAGLWKEDD